MVKPWEQDWSVDDAGVGAGGGSAKPWEQDWSVEGQVRAPEKKRSFADDIAEFGLDFGKRAAGAVVSGVASIPLGIEKGVKSLVRSSVEASGDSMLPAGIYNPGIDTDEAIHGPETARDKDARLLAAERAASAVPNLPGARTLAKAGREGREAIHATTSEATQRAVADSQISGNIFKGEIDFGSDPSVRGYVMQAADVFGSMLPVIAGSLVTRRPGVGGAIGGGMAAGEGAESAAEFIAGRTDDQLLEESPFFARLVNGGASFEEARRLTADKASESAALLQGAVASVGDRFTGKLVTGKLDPVLARAAGNSVLGRAAAGGALSAAEEGLQEVGEGVASDIGVTSVVPSKEIGEDSAANLVLGALGGGPAGVGRGAYSGVRERISGGGRDVADQTQAGAGGQASETSGGQEAPAAGGDAAAAPGLPDTGRATTPVQALGVAAAPTDEAERALRQPANLTALDRANELDTEVARIEQRMTEVTPENGYGPAFDAERADLAQQAEAARAERDAIASTWPAAVRGAPASFSTEAGVKLEGDYALMDADDLVTSHDENLRQNPVFPAELQPRDRTRSASELQVSGIVQRLDPARLGMSADAATGAPIIGADGLVESGNARTIALKRVYQANGQKAADYRAWLRESAQQFGITSESVDSMRKPVLVRIRNTPVNRAEFARQANQSTIQRMSPSEQAAADAKRLTNLDGLEPDDSGDFSASRDFIRQFMATLPITEQADMIESDGRLSTAGYRRIQNAILAKAYGESPTLRRMTESLDNNLANISKALTRAAPAIAAARERIQAGSLHDADIAPDIVQAVEGLSAIKDKGWTVAQELGQTDLTGPKYSPEAAELLQFLANNIRSPRRIAEFLQRYHEALEAVGNPNQGSLLGDTEAPTRGELIQQALEKVAPGPGRVAEPDANGYDDDRANESSRLEDPGQPDGGAEPIGAGSSALASVRRGDGSDLRPRAQIAGLGIAADIQRAGSGALVGREVNGADHLAELAQVYRDPRYETFRVFFTKGNTIVHATGVSARMPGHTPMIPKGMSQDEYIQFFKDEMARTEADGYYILHNHPSGNPAPSGADLSVTEHLAGQVPGMRAHVVINSNKYAVIDPGVLKSAIRGEVSTRDMVSERDFGEDQLLKASKPAAVLGATINGPDALVGIGKSMQKPGWVTLVGTDSGGRVRAVAEAPSSILTRNNLYLAATVRRFMRMSGSRSVFAVGGNADINSEPIVQAVLSGILRDAVPEIGKSLGAQGRGGWASNPLDRTDGRFVAEDARPDQTDTPEFKRWFGDSKVVDANGKPLVVYHGTKADFSTFSLEKFGQTDGGWAGEGFYFAPNPAEASVYATSMAAPYGNSNGANVMPVYLSAKKPLEWRLGSEASRTIQAKRNELNAKEFAAWVQSQGYDSIHITSPDIGSVKGEDQWVVFRPEQIKSAIGNNGNFDPQNPDIRLSRADDGAAAASNVLQELAATDELFQFPKSEATTLEGVAADINPEIEVKRSAGMPGRTEYMLTMPGGQTATLTVRPANPYGETVYGFDLRDGEMDNITTERPGENPEDVPPDMEDVWIDVSNFKGGDRGAAVYAIAANFAHNTGRIFIGDPAGLSDQAMRRRPEQMLSSALKFGTTRHLAPHPRQVDGDAKLGVPPLKWVYGDDLGNIRRLIDLNLAAMENAGETSITFDPQHGTYRDSEGNPLDRDGISLAWQAGVGRRAGAGSTTLARSAVLASLVREEGQAQRGTDGRPAVVLEALLRVGRQFPAETEGVFYSRRDLNDTAGEEDGGRISYDELKALADRLKAGMPNMPRVHVLADPSQAPKALRAYIIRQDAWYDVEGAMHDGELYLFASGLADAERAEHVLIEHEAAHYGLRAVLGPSLKTAMRLVYMQNGKVRKAVTEMQKRGRLSDVVATEEVIVDIPTAELAKLRGWRRVVAMVRDWLAERGYQALAQKLTELVDGSLTEQERADLFVAELVGAARDYVAGQRPGRAGVAQGTRLSGSIAEVIERQERWLEREAQARGYRDVEDLAARNYATFEKLAKLWQTKNPEDARLSRSRGPGQQAPAERAEALIQQKAGGAAPVDLLFRAATKAARVDRLAGAIYDRAGDLLDRLVPEKVKAGIVADYGVPEAVIDQRTMLQGRQRVQLRKVVTLIDKLSTLTRAESRVAYEWMNMDGADPKAYLSMMQGLPEESVKVLQDVQKMIDDLSQEAVRLGQLDQDAFERNRFAYLRRSYAKHITEQTRGEKAKRSRVISILGDQYKGRGLVQAEPMARMQAAAPDWWGRKLAGGKADTALKGQKFIRLEKRAQPGAASRAIAGMDPAGPGRIERVIYWPADRAITSEYADWTRADTWEVRDVKGGDVVLWRDFTKEEREQMGEVDEARFAIAKTLQGMIHDVETGRYLEWLARNYAKAEGQAIPGAVVEASERYRDTFAASEWVKVPDTKIPGTSVKKYGALAGHYLPGPIWNDLRQVVGGEFKPFGDTYAKILNLWKTSKTALSPAVHMNNVMSNFVMADWQDVRAAHVGKALRIILAASGKKGGIADAEAAREVLSRYKDSGGDIGSWVTQEIAKEQIDPLLADLKGELMATADGAVDAQAGVYAALQHALGARFPAAWEALKAGKSGKAAAKAGGALIDLYQAEDDVFRLAAWLKAKEEGADDLAAGKKARRSFLDYNINAPWVQAMRKSAWPFVSFTYRAVPLLAEIAGKKPHKLFKLMAFAGGLNALGMLMGGDGGDDERKLLPEEKAGSIWGMVPKLVRMPWNDAHGSPVYLDIRRWIPVGDVFDVGQGNAAVPMLPGLMPGGPLVIAGEIVLNKQSFTGKPITQETDTAAEKTGKLLDYLVKTFSPNLPIPNPIGYGIEAATGVQDAGQTYSWTGIAGSMTGRSDAFGREMSTAQAVASALGLKLGSYPADVLRRNLGAKAMAEASEIDKNIGQLKRQFATGRISRDEFDRLASVQAEKKRALMEKLRERLD